MMSEDKNPTIDLSGSQGAVVNNQGQVNQIFTEETAYNVAGLISPFLGLKSFTYADQARYAGREREVTQALTQLINPGQEQALFFVTGVSGSGKSSFAQAGLLPALEQHYQQQGIATRYAVMRPGQKPMTALARALALLGLPEDETFNRVRPFMVGLTNAPPPHQAVGILIVDQFEELFTQSDADQKSIFIAILNQLPAFDHVHMHIICTFRADYLPELFKEAALYRIARQGTELREMDVAALERAIQAPLQALYRNKRFEPSLLRRLAEDAAGDPAYLPLLQTTLDWLWREKKRLQPIDYKSLAEAFREHADNVLTYVDHDGDKKTARTPIQQTVIIDLLLDLVRVSPDSDPKHDVRQRRTLDELVREKPERAELITQLSSEGARLLSEGQQDMPNQAEPIKVVDLIHETLITQWPRLRDIVQTQRERLQQRVRFDQQVRDWLKNNRSDGLLLTNKYLEQARELERLGDIEVKDADSMELIRRSVAQLERAQQEKLRRARLFAGVVGVLAVVAAITAVIALRLRNEAAAQTKVAQSREWAALANNQIETDARSGIVLALRAISDSQTSEADDALRRAFLSPARSILVIGDSPRDKVTSVAFAPDDSVLAGASAYVVRRWDVASGKEITCPTNSRIAHPGPVDLTKDPNVEIADIAFSRDGRQLATASDDSTARIWDTVTCASLGVPLAHSEPVNSVQFSPDGQSLLTTSGGKVLLWNLRDHTYRTLFAQEDVVTSARFNATGTKIVIAGEESNTAYLVSLDPSTDEPIALQHDAAMFDAEFSSDGRWVITASRDKTARLWDAISGEEVGRIAHFGEVRRALFSPDMQFAVTTSGSDIFVWQFYPEEIDTKFSENPRVLKGHSQLVRSIGFSNNGFLLASGSEDLTARIWDLFAGERPALTQLGRNVHSTQFFSNTNWLVTLENTGTIHVRATNSLGSTMIVTAAHALNRVAVANNRLFGLGNHGVEQWDIQTGRILSFTAFNQSQSPNSQNTERSENQPSPIWINSEVDHIESISPDGTYAVSVRERAVTVWNVVNSQVVLTREVTSPLGLRFSADGARLALMQASQVHVLQLSSDVPVLTLQLPSAKFSGVRFSGDGQYIITTDITDTTDSEDFVRIWNAQTGQLLDSWHDSADTYVSDADMSPDKQWVITAVNKRGRFGENQSGVVHLWAWDSIKKTHRLAATLRGHLKPITSVWFSQDGKQVITIGEDGTARFYFTYLQDLVTRAYLRIQE